MWCCRSLTETLSSVFSTEIPAAFPNSKDHIVPTEDLHRARSLPHTDSGIGDDQVSVILNGSSLDHRVGGPGAMGELMSTLSSEVTKSQEKISESPSGELLKPPSCTISVSQYNKGINVKEILKSLVAAPVEGTEAGLEPCSYPDPAAKAQAILPLQFHSFDR